MKKLILFTLCVLVVLVAGLIFYFLHQSRPPLETKFAESLEETEISSDFLEIKMPEDSALLDNPNHVYQTFNNCGPATLSMILSRFGKNVSQKELRDQMRPYQVLSGDNDDKTIFTSEFVDWAKKYGLEAVSRVNGDINTLKYFTVNGIPVVVKTWLHVNEDIGHFRIVRGFDENKSVIIQDDSYEGPNKKIKYYDFLSMWQPFNYAYIIVYRKDQENLVKAIIGEDWDEKASWQNALTRAQKEADLDSQNVYAVFNKSTALYHLGDFQKSVEAFEKVEKSLPKRMLWYQIEPILAYKELGNFDKVFQITNHILENGNRAFSELYQIRGEIYLSQGNKQKAKEEFDKALFYNKNFNHPLL